MTILLVTNDLWAAVAPHLPPEPPRPKGGRPRVHDRRALTGIAFVLVTGIPWERLPKEVAGCSGMTCWRRLREWQRAGAWEMVLGELRRRLGPAMDLDRDRGAPDDGPTGASGTRVASGDRRRRAAAAARRAPSPAASWAAVPAVARSPAS